MGYFRHHAIAVTSYNKVLLEKARVKAVELFGELVTPVIETWTNQYYTFFISPDGSKEGWDYSDKCDVSRGEFVSWLNGMAWEDGSSSLRYCEFFYGDDEHESGVVTHN